MTIDKKTNGSTLCAEFSGRLDTVTTPEAESVMKDGLDSYTELKLDFAKLDYISSAGLRLLLSLQKMMNSRGGSMRIVNANETVKEIFEVTGFSEIMNIE